MDKRIYILVCRDIDQNNNIVKEVQTVFEGFGADLDTMVREYQEFLSGCGFYFGKKELSITDVFEE